MHSIRLSLLTVVFTLAAACAALATPFWQIEQTLQAGGSVTVGDELAGWQISQLIGIGKARVTVRAKGFAAWQVTSFLSEGGSVLVDSSFAAWQVSSFISQGKARVKVLAEGFASWQTNQFKSEGAVIVGVPGQGQPAFWQLKQTLEQGGNVAVGSELAAWQIKELCQIGGNRVTVRAEGFAAWQLQEFAGLGANIDYRTKREASFEALNR
jgi:hypothetical protein